MSGKLDQSLDEILSTSTRRASRGAKGGAVGRRTRRVAKPAVPTPVGGVKKPQRGAKNGAKPIPTGPSGGIGGNGESKIMVSNLPKDVTEAMVKEYFVKAVGPVKRVEVSYGPGGVSRGIATIFFTRPESAARAVETQNGVQVDGRNMKIDVILDARRAAAIPPPKGLGERITQPKSQPKSAAVTKGTTATRGKAARGRGGKAKNGRPAKKTAEELDSEMADYFGGSNTEGAVAAAQPAANGNGDAAMDDEIL